MQQAKVIRDSIDVKVGIYCGSSNNLKGHRYWEKEMEQFEVCYFVTILLIQYSFLSLKLMNTLILVWAHKTMLCCLLIKFFDFVHHFAGPCNDSSNSLA